MNFHPAEEENYTIENRLFISSILIGIFLGIIGSFSNYFLVEHVFSYLIPATATALLVFFYYLARFRGYFKKLAILSILIAFFVISFIWLLNGGINGSNDLIFIVALVLGLIIVNEKEKIYVLIFYTLVKTILYLIQFYYPDSIINYSSEKARWLDVLLTSFSTSIIIYLIVNFIQRNYHIEKEKVENSKAELTALNSKLEDSNAAKDLLLSIISHDLRSPFNSMIGFSNMLADSADKAQIDQIRKYAKAINTSALETYYLLDNLLKWSGLQKGGISAKKERHSLLIIINELLAFFKEQLTHKKLQLKNTITESVFVYCDIEITKTIFRNLLANAIKFTDHGGLITISTIERNSTIEVKIADTGIGIAEEKIPELFAMKKKIPQRGTQNEKGIGLGLYLCKALIEVQGGEIWVKSKPGQGTDFYFTLEKN